MLLYHYTAETCSSRQLVVLNPIQAKIQTRDFHLDDVNARQLTACFRTLSKQKTTRRKGRSRSWYHPNSEGGGYRLPSRRRIGALPPLLTVGSATGLGE